MCRYNLNWYNKRIKQNKNLKDFLVGKIVEHDQKFKKQQQELYYLNYEDLLELAIAAANKDLKIVLGAGKDFDNGGDAKVSIVRLNCSGRRYSANVKVKLKKLAQSLIYEPINEKFYFFVLPSIHMQEIDIPFDFQGNPKTSNRWWNFEVSSFEHMANANLETSKNQKKKDAFDQMFCTI